MRKRITLISLFDDESLNKINQLVQFSGNRLCKVPYHNYIENREEVDTLPFHLTICAWDKELEYDVLELLNTIKLSKIVVEIDDVKIMNGVNNSFVLYLSIKENDDLTLLQKYIYNKLPVDKYNPEKFTFHITLAIDDNYDKIMEIKSNIEKRFKRFEIEFCSLGLFEIYPAKLIKKV